MGLRRFRDGCVATSSTTAAVTLAAALLVAGCGAESPSATPSRSTSSAPTASPTPAPSPTTPLTTSAAPTPEATPAPQPSATESADPRWQFYTDDHAWHTSPWFEGSHRVMIGYGCNTAPWYSHDSRCPGRQGFHHGIDIAMPCGTPMFSAVDGVVVDPSAPGAPGSAYGAHPFRIRSGGHDIVIGHSNKVFVRAGQQVRAGERIALVGDSGAPDGCHLHFEVRRAGGGLSSAVDPAPLLQLS